MIKKITLLVRPSLYNLYEYFNHSLAEALQSLGVVVKVINVSEDDIELKAFPHILKPEEQDATCSFSWIPNLPKNTIPHFYINLSPSFALIGGRQADEIVASTDRQENEAAKTLKTKRSFFLPLAANREIKSASEKPYDVVFCGGSYDHETVEKIYRKRENAETVQIIENSIHDALKDHSKSIFFIVLDNCKKAGVAQTRAHCRYVYAYLYGYERTQLIRSIKDAYVHVVGGTVWDFYDQRLRGWGQLLSDCPNITVHPAINYQEYIELSRKSKIILNTAPNFRDGCHERVFIGLASGAVPVTNENPWTLENFTHKEDLILFGPDQWKDVNDNVNQLLANEKWRQEIADRGREKVMQHHTWHIRAQQLLEEIAR